MTNDIPCRTWNCSRKLIAALQSQKDSGQQAYPTSWPVLIQAIGGSPAMNCYAAPPCRHRLPVKRARSQRTASIGSHSRKMRQRSFAARHFFNASFTKRAQWKCPKSNSGPWRSTFQRTCNNDLLTTGWTPTSTLESWNSYISNCRNRKKNGMLSFETGDSHLQNWS